MTREILLKNAKPILFNTDMVRAILDGRKTVTRRVVKQNVDGVLNSQYHKEHPEVPDKTLIEKLCQTPYEPGDILCVRESWAQGGCAICEKYECYGSCGAAKYLYRADYEEDDLQSFKEDGYKWRPSIHMPKEAARIFLKVKDVRVERLQDMSFEDCLSEGAFVYLSEGHFDRSMVEPEAKKKFSKIWDSTIKKSDLATYGWDATPWVWVIEFERTEPGKE